MRQGDRAFDVRALPADFGGADGAAAGRPRSAPPERVLRQVTRLRVAPLHDEPGHRAMEALAVVEAAFHEVDDVGHGLRRLVRIGFERERRLWTFRRR